MIDIRKVDFSKSDGLVPSIIQDYDTNKVLMLGYMNEAALDATVNSGLVTFYSRSRGRLWTKGEESQNHLILMSITMDCDADTLLIKAKPKGPVCHTGEDTCWKENNDYIPLHFLNHLEEIIDQRKQEASGKSYTSSLFNQGINKIAQKVGEEAVELIIEAKDDNKELFLGEAADLIFHLLILLKAKNIKLNDVVEVLETRHKSSKK